MDVERPLAVMANNTRTRFETGADLTSRGHGANARIAHCAGETLAGAEHDVAPVPAGRQAARREPRIHPAGRWPTCAMTVIGCIQSHLPVKGGGDPQAKVPPSAPWMSSARVGGLDV